MSRNIHRQRRGDVLGRSVWKTLLCLEGPVVVTSVEVLGEGVAGRLIVDVRLPANHRLRCGRCRRPCPRYDPGRVRTWRAPDVGVCQALVRARIPRVYCRVHKVVVAHVPWARHGAGHTRAFDDQVAWSVVVSNKTAVGKWFRIAWSTVGSIIARVEADFAAGTDRLAGLRRIGIDEISYRRGHKYLTVVVDHDTGRLVWAAPGRDKATLGKFFAQLDADGAGRSALLTHVSADGAEWINHMVTLRAPQAQLCMDPFHVVRWAGEVLDEARRVSWRVAVQAARAAAAQLKQKIEAGLAPRRPGPVTGAGSDLNVKGARLNDRRVEALRHARWALAKNPQNLSDAQKVRLEWIASADPDLYRVYGFKEALRYVFELKGEAGVQALDVWLTEAAGSGIKLVEGLADKIGWYRDRIAASLRHRLSNGLIESTNTKLRAVARAAFGFHGPAPMIALAFLTRGGSRPALPGRV
ncbi:MAG: ISL3 family transposase [Acetobacteraceae bacterium]|nr:MAG: ISL3 family transposase [Acetobacteraceae bacterium]